MKFFGRCNISRTFGFYNNLINRQKALKGVLSMSILQTIDLKKYYGTEPNITRALDGVNFSVNEGAFVAVVGTSGSGKSTLLHMMGGLDTPTSGTVTVRGEELAKKNDEQLTMRRGATLCMDKMKGLLLQDKLVEYAYRQLSGEPDSTFHKLLFVHAEDTSAGALQAAMLQKGLDLILVSSIADAKCRIFEDEEIELILCDLELPDGTAMELFHTLRRVAGMFQMKNPPVRLLPFFILTENNDLATEYEYRHEGVNDYITAPVNIPELIRRVLFFVE